MLASLNAEVNKLNCRWAYQQVLNRFWTVWLLHLSGSGVPLVTEPVGGIYVGKLRSVSTARRISGIAKNANLLDYRCYRMKIWPSRSGTSEVASKGNCSLSLGCTQSM